MELTPTLITIILGICSIAAFFIGQYTGAKKKGYEEGVRDTKIDELSNKVDELVKEFKKWNMETLLLRLTKLEDRVDVLEGKKSK